MHARFWRLAFIIAIFTVILLPLRSDKPASLQSDAFDGPKLNDDAWVRTEENDMKEKTIDIVDGRLRLRVDTMETRDETVKFLGVRTKKAFDLKDGLDVAVDIDWNKQANGCYLTAGLVLCPTATDKNPNKEPAWVKIEYVGVPPGKNGRAQVVVKENNREQYIFTEGWPKEQRTGRPIGLQRIRLVIKGTRLQFFENDKLLFEQNDFKFAPPQVYAYLQMSSHSNYRAREIFFDNFSVTPAAEPK